MPSAPPWTNQDLHLYHGTSHSSAINIVNSGVDIDRSRKDTDFGRGFYCTTIRAQASAWAKKKGRPKLDLPALVEFRISRTEMASLEILPFVSANQLDQDLWSLVYFCRNWGLNHGRTDPYDIVCGPLINWPKQTLKQGEDQVSFHTDRAQNLLNIPGKRSIVELW